MEKKLSEEYLQECLDRAYSADPTGFDVVIKDLNKRMKKLVAALRKKNMSDKSGLKWVRALTEMDKARFWSKVKDTGYCWEWQAGKDSSGYGTFKVFGKDEKAHRVAYSIINGDIPEDLHVLHKCDNPACVNPTHIFTGTPRDNMNDKIRKGRGKTIGRASKYHGVAFRKDSNNWRAHVWNGRKHLSLGSFKTQEDAAKRRDEEVLKLKLDLPLNFPI